MTQAKTSFLGLAPFLRMSISGKNLQPIGQEMLAMIAHQADDANLLMNLSTVLFCLEQPDIALSIQEQALAMQHIYYITAQQQPAKLRLLIIMVAGDLASNTPLDCLLENSAIDLIFYYVSLDKPLSAPIPGHDVLIVAINEADANEAILKRLEDVLAHWSKPIINAPQHIPNTDRNTASMLLQDVVGLLMPPTLRASRQTLSEIALGKMQLTAQFLGCDFPLILRPLDSYGGHGLDKINNPQDIKRYLAKEQDTEFFLSSFIDYSSEDGLFRKFRIVLINGTPYPCHMGISSDWIIHYVNAGMYEDAQKRQEESNFMKHFNTFAQRHKIALEAIYYRSQLDYLGIDCAETRDGQLLIFEIDHAMVVHAMDPENLFPYKQVYMKKVKDAFQDYLIRLTVNHTIATPI